MVTSIFTAPKYSWFFFPLNTFKFFITWSCNSKNPKQKNKLHVPEVKNVGNREKTKSKPKPTETYNFCSSSLSLTLKTGFYRQLKESFLEIKT